MKGLRYEPPPRFQVKPAGAWRIPHHVLRHLGHDPATGRWNPERAATVAHKLFGPGLTIVDDPYEDDDLQIPKSTVIALGGGSLEAGQKVLQRWADMLKPETVWQPDGAHHRQIK